MKRFLSLLTVLAFVGITNVWGQSDVYTSCVTLTAGTNGSSCKVRLSSTGTQYDAMKLGTSSKTGTMTFKVPSGTTKIYIHVAGWNNDGASRKLNISASKGTLGSSSIDLTNDTGISGSSTTFTLSTPGNATSSYYAAISISNVTAESTITLTTSAKRAVVWGVNYGKYTVSYNSNGGSGTMTDSYSPYPQSGQVTVKPNSFTAPTGKTFNGWKTGATSGTSYAAGAKFSISANTTLYAQWACITPTISSQTVSSATYTAGDTPSNLSVTASGGSLSYQWKQSATENGTYVNVTSGTGGTTATYTPSTSAASDLWYQCTVTNTGSSCGTTALSNKAHIVVNEAVACTATPSIGAVSLNGPFSLTQVGVQCASSGAGDNCEITEYGWVWSDGATNTNPLIEGTGVTNAPKTSGAPSGSNGSFTGTLSGSFTVGHTYYYKAYVTNGKPATTYSTVQTFTPRSVTFKVGDDVISTVYVNNGSTVSAPANDPEKTGWDFQEWQSGGVAYDFDEPVTGNLVLDAYFTVQSFALTWDFTTGGSTTSTTHTTGTVDYGNNIVYPADNTMSKTGYTFAGWDPAKPQTMPNHALTITAQWTADQYAITYYDGDATSATKTFSGTHETGYPTQHTYGTATTLKGATKTGYTFGGWFVNKECTGDAVTNLAADGYLDGITLYAQWTENKYSIAYNKNGGGDGTGTAGHSNVNWSADVTLNSCGFTAPTDKYFLGWDKDKDATSATYSAGSSYSKLSDTDGATVTLYAIWKEYTYTNYRIICCTKHNVELAGDGAVTGGTFSSNKNKACENDPVVLTAVAATGYDFTSWDATYSDGEIKHATFVDATANPGTMTMPAYSATVTPTFTPEVYTITYKDKGNVTFSGAHETGHPETHTYNAATTLKGATKTDWNFIGWYDNADCDGEPVTSIAANSITADITLYAKWVEDNKWVVTISAPENGTIKVSYTEDETAKEFTSGSREILKSTEITITATGSTGYDCTSLTKEGEPYTSGTSMTLTSAITIAATFGLHTYSITYNLDGGNNNVGNPANYQYTSSDITLQDPTKTGYTFKGWYNNSDLAEEHKVTGVAIATGSAADKEFWAKWEINEYTLTWTTDGDALEGDYTGKSGKVDYGTAIVAPNTPTKTGYTFAGWHNGTSVVTPAATMPAEDVTYTATWTIINYEVHWWVNGQEWTDKDGSTNADYNTKVTLPTAPTKADGCGDKFVGWTTSEYEHSTEAPGVLFKTQEDSPTITGDTNFYAVFADYGE